jgi:hypothetical protein
MKITENMLFALYAGVVLLTIAYLVFTEGVLSGSHYFQMGGKDIRFTFHDVTLILVFLLSGALAVVSTKAYLKKNNERLFFVSTAFFLFAIKAALKITEDVVIGYFGFIAISIQTLELLILISLFFALLTK